MVIDYVLIMVTHLLEVELVQQSKEVDMVNIPFNELELLHMDFKYEEFHADELSKHLVQELMVDL